LNAPDRLNQVIRLPWWRQDNSIDDTKNRMVMNNEGKVSELFSVKIFSETFEKFEQQNDALIQEK
jgi:hypothetical protein